MTATGRRRRLGLWEGAEGLVYQLRWPRGEYVIVEPPPLPGRVAGEPGPKVFGTPFVLGAGHRLRKAAPPWPVPWPVGGVFAPTWWPRGRPARPAEVYNPVEVAADILLDAQRIDPDDRKTLLRFVNRWGLLGVGVPGDPQFLDGVAFVGHCLGQLRDWLEGFDALRRGRRRLRQGTRRPWTWRDVAFELSERLLETRLGALPGARRLILVYRPRNLFGALWLELWRQAAELPRHRRCPECRALFIPGRANQQYCTRLCANRPTVRKWKREQKRKRRAAQHHEEG